jgi:hypothetical protein
MSTVADPDLMDLQTIRSWDETLAELGPGPFSKGLSEWLRGTVLLPPAVFDAQKGDAKNCCVYAAGYLSILPAYLPTIIEATLFMVKTIPFPTGQQG